MPYSTPLMDLDVGDLLVGSRVCRRCGERKSITEFHWAHGAKENSRKYRRRICKVCCDVAQRALRSKDPERYKKLSYVNYIKGTYGLSQSDLGDLRALQNDCCAICRKKFEPEGRKPHVDHDHATGQVRGLLCIACNTALGKFRDSVEILENAIRYLQHPTTA